MKPLNKYIFKTIVVILFLLLLISGCKSTRYVPDNRYLLSDIDIKIDNDKIDKEELSTYLRQKENLKILGIVKFHLWLYNLSVKKNEDGWLKNIGESPVIYDLSLKKRVRTQDYAKRLNDWLYLRHLRLVVITLLRMLYITVSEKKCLTYLLIR